MNATVDQRWETALTALATVERVTLDDVQRVAAALSLDEIELANAVTEKRHEADDVLTDTTDDRIGPNAVVVQVDNHDEALDVRWTAHFEPVLDRHVLVLGPRADGKLAEVLRLLATGVQR